MLRKRKMTSGRSQENSFIVITLYQESNCTCRKKNHFPIPLQYVDVTRTPHTSLDVLLEKHIEDYWNVVGEKELSDAWTGFTRFVLLQERPPEEYTWSRRRLTRKQKTSRPNDVWPDMWKLMSAAPKKKAKEKWAIKKPKLDNARQLRGIFFIEPEDEEFKHTMKNARRKLAAMPCKIPIKSSEKTQDKICLCCWCRRKHETKAGRSSTQTSPRSYHWKREEFSDSLQSCSQIYSYASSYQNSGSKGSSGKRIGKLEKIPAWQLTKVRNKKEVIDIDEARNKGRNIHFASLMDLCHLKNSRVEPRFQKYKGRVVLRGDIVKMILVRTKYSLNKDRQRPKWQQQK